MQKSEFGQKCHLRGFVPTATICEYELPTNLQSFTQKDLTEEKPKNIPKSFRGVIF